MNSLHVFILFHYQMGWGSGRWGREKVTSVRIRCSATWDGVAPKTHAFGLGNAVGDTKFSVNSQLKNRKLLYTVMMSLCHVFVHIGPSTDGSFYPGIY